MERLKAWLCVSLMLSPFAFPVVAKAEGETETATTGTTKTLAEVFQDVSESVSQGYLPNGFDMVQFVDNVSGMCTNLAGTFSDTYFGVGKNAIKSVVGALGFSDWGGSTVTNNGGAYTYNLSDEFVKYCVELALTDIVQENSNCLLITPQYPTGYTYNGTYKYVNDSSITAGETKWWNYINEDAYGPFYGYLSDITALYWQDVGSYVNVYDTNNGDNFISLGTVGRQVRILGGNYPAVVWTNYNLAKSMSARVGFAYRTALGGYSVSNNALIGTDWGAVNTANNTVITSQYNSGDITTITELNTLLDVQLEGLEEILSKIDESTLEILEYVKRIYELLQAQGLPYTEVDSDFYSPLINWGELAQMGVYSIGDAVESESVPVSGEFMTEFFNIKVVRWLVLIPLIVAIVLFLIVWR